jgi:hypothetical protein
VDSPTCWVVASSFVVAVVVLGYSSPVEEGAVVVPCCRLVVAVAVAVAGTIAVVVAWRVAVASSSAAPNARERVAQYHPVRVTTDLLLAACPPSFVAIVLVDFSTCWHVRPGQSSSSSSLLSSIFTSSSCFMGVLLLVPVARLLLSNRNRNRNWPCIRKALTCYFRVVVGALA